MRCATPNVTSTMWFIEIGKCCDVMSSASASMMPTTVVAERRGKRAMRRATMRVLPSRLRAAFSMPCPKRLKPTGAGGASAAAGGNRAARSTACAAPSIAAISETTTAQR